MFRDWQLIVKNAVRNRRRSILTASSIAASFCLLGVLFAMYNSLFGNAEAPPAQALRIISRNKVALVLPLPLSYQQKIQPVPGVREVMAWQWFGGVYKDPKNFFTRLGVEPAKLFALYPEYRVPDDQKKAFQQERTACMVGRGLADKYNIKLGDRVTIKGDSFPVDLEMTARAIYDTEGGGNTLYFNLQYLLDSLPPSGRDSVEAFTILADSPESVDRISQTIDAQFRNSAVQTKTESEQAFRLSFLSMIGNVKAYLLFVCAAVTFTLLLVSANTIAMSARERVREVGILKTLGFTPGAITRLILGESALISLSGGVAGCVLAILACWIVRRAPTNMLPVRTLQLQPRVVLLCLGVAVVIGLVSAIVPAYLASRKSIVNALRAEV